METIAKARRAAKTKTRLGMTADEREELIIAMATFSPWIIFNYATFEDGSLGVRVAYGDREDQWMTFHSYDEWWNPPSKALMDLYEQCHLYSERKAGIVHDF